MCSSILSLTSALDFGEWSTPRTGRFTPGKENLTHCTGGWVGPRASLDGYRKYEVINLINYDHKQSNLKKQMKKIMKQAVVFEERVFECRFVSEDSVSRVGAK
jgi:hypothetical protein